FLYVCFNPLQRKVVTATRRHIGQIRWQSSSSSVLPTSFTEKRVRLLTEEDAVALIREPLCGREVNKEVIQSLLAWAGRHPYLLTAAAERCFDLQDQIGL